MFVQHFGAFAPSVGATHSDRSTLDIFFGALRLVRSTGGRRACRRAGGIAGENAIIVATMDPGKAQRPHVYGVFEGYCIALNLHRS